MLYAAMKVKVRH